jgi:hypothetical protein
MPKPPTPEEPPPAAPARKHRPHRYPEDVPKLNDLLLEMTVIRRGARELDVLRLRLDARLDRAEAALSEHIRELELKKAA